MDAYTHTILAVIVVAMAWYGGRWALIREARRHGGEELKRFAELITAINHMGITPEPKQQEHDQEPTQLDLFLTQGSSGGTD